MPKINTANVIAICSLVMIGLFAGIGGTVAYGAMAEAVRANTANIVVMQSGDNALRDAVVDLRIAVAALTEKIESAHGGEHD
jgi:hypothetical protein